MNNKLRLVIIFQLVFFAAWAGWLLTFSSRTVAEFCLDTLPADPRDPLSGTYLALRYDISTPKGADCERALADRKTLVHVQLGPTGRTVSAGGKELPVYGAQACSSGKPASDGKIWVRGNRKGRWGGGQVYYGIEKFFISEDDTRKNWTSGNFVARVKVDGLGNLRLLELIKKPGAGGGAQISGWNRQAPPGLSDRDEGGPILDSGVEETGPPAASPLTKAAPPPLNP